MRRSLSQWDTQTRSVFSLQIGLQQSCYLDGNRAACWGAPDKRNA